MEGKLLETRIGKEKASELSQSLSFFQITVYAVGVILGAGIYALIGEAAGIAGNTLWIAFIVAALVASFTALSYAELSALFPKTAAEYVYVKNATRSKFLAFFVGYMALLGVLFSAPTVALGFGGYLEQLTGIPVILGAVFLILACSTLNYRGIQASANVNTVFALIETAGLVIIVLLGIWFIGKVDLIDLPQLTSNPGMYFAPITAAAALIFFAYLGFEEVANIAEETKDAANTMPKALLTAVAITTVLYILVSMISVSVVPHAELAASSGPLALVAERSAGELGATTGPLLGLIALFATANTVLVMLIVASRMLYGLAKERVLPVFLSEVDRSSKVPRNAVLAAFLLTVLFLSLGGISFIAETANFAIFITFMAVNGALIYLRYSKPDLKRPFKVPLNIGRFPVISALGFLVALFMTSQLSGSTALFGAQVPVIALGMGLVALSVPIYGFLNGVPKPD